MKSSRTEYQSYLVRLWRSGERETWRVTLEQVGNHERFSFADLEQFFAFLRSQTDRVKRTDQA